VQKYHLIVINIVTATFCRKTPSVQILRHALECCVAPLLMFQNCSPVMIEGALKNKKTASFN